jgi:outer membrane murein-binding lipoprotein Lpp
MTVHCKALSILILSMRKLLIVILVLALAILAYVNYTKRVQLESDVRQLSVKNDQLQTGNNPQNVAKANEIIAKVRKHMEIPTDPEPTVATIVDVNALRGKNDFYKNAKNGDNLIVTTSRAILYDPVQDIIIDVVPVQLQTTAQPSPAPAAAQPGV